MKRYVSIWFRHLLTDWYERKNPARKGSPLVIAEPQRGRMVIAASSHAAEKLGIEAGMVLADARAVFPALVVVENVEMRPDTLLRALADWTIRFTPIVGIDLQDGLILDATGCTHLWGGEEEYLRDIYKKFDALQYRIRLGMAATPGLAWAAARYGKLRILIEEGNEREVLSNFPPASLRLEGAIVEKLHKLGLYRVEQFMDMPASVLRRRFGTGLPYRLAQVLGQLPEIVEPIVPATLYCERLPAMEPVRTANGIAYAMTILLENMCRRLAEENLGLQKAVLKTFRVDGKVQEITIGTHAPTCSIKHLFRLFELKIATIRPGLGIELFVLEAPIVLDMPPEQANLWNLTGSSNLASAGELLDRLAGRGGAASIHRYLPVEHHLPERSIREARSLEEKSATTWQMDRPRPTHLLAVPEPIQVTAPVPDYPPLLFRYRGELYRIQKADGPERIEQEWWITDGLHRDYYMVEDEEGRRFWIFRSGHYDQNASQWFVHGFFS